MYCSLLNKADGVRQRNLAVEQLSPTTDIMLYYKLQEFRTYHNGNNKILFTTDRSTTKEVVTVVVYTRLVVDYTNAETRRCVALLHVEHSGEK